MFRLILTSMHNLKLVSSYSFSLVFNCTILRVQGSSLFGLSVAKNKPSYIRPVFNIVTLLWFNQKIYDLISLWLLSSPSCSPGLPIERHHIVLNAIVMTFGVLVGFENEGHFSFDCYADIGNGDQ